MNKNQEKKILTEKVATFFSKKVEYNSLSNFWVRDVEICGRVYESGEHAFHGEKYVFISELLGATEFEPDEERIQKLRDYGKKFEKPCIWGKSGNEIKKMGGKKGFALTPRELELWSEVAPRIQKMICMYKMRYEEVKTDLKNSGTKILVHPAMRCSEEKVKMRTWEGKAIVGEDGEVTVLGGNMLGNIWMDIRKDI